MHKFSVRCPDDQIDNSTLSKLCTVINACQEKLLIPLNSTQSAYVFGLGEIKVNDSGKLNDIILKTENKLTFDLLFLRKLYLYRIKHSKLQIFILPCIFNL